MAKLFKTFVNNIKEFLDILVAYGAYFIKNIIDFCEIKMIMIIIII